MAYNPKLEVYQVWLNPNNNLNKSFRDFFFETNTSRLRKESSNEEVFNDFFTDFIAKIDGDGFIRNKKTKKAFTAYDARPTTDNQPTISFNSNQTIIKGTIEGGKYGQKRNKSTMADKTAKEGINADDIIMDKFYFCLYTPLDSDLGVLFLQSYSGDTISGVFNEFIRKLFSEKGSYKKARVEKFVPKRIADDFKASSNIKKFSFSSRFMLEQLSNSPIGQEEEEFVIRVEAVSKNGLPKSSLPNWLRTLFAKEVNSRPLSEFSNGKVYLNNGVSKRQTSFAIDSDFDIKPVIYLDGKIRILEDGLPDFIELESYCLNLLQNEIIPEMYPEDDIEER